MPNHAERKDARGRGPRCPICGKPKARKTLTLGPTVLSPWVLQCGCVLDGARRDQRVELLRRLVTAGVPQRYRSAFMAGAVDRARIHPAARKMAGLPGQGPGLLLMGNWGTGKTFSGCYVLQAWLEKGIGPCRYAHLPSMATRLDRNEIASMLSKCRLVHLDDLGYQKAETAPFVFALMDKLYRSETPMIVSTTYSPRQIRDSIGGEHGAAVLDRLRSYPKAEYKSERTMRGKDVKRW